jgi:hypothetical protein
MTFGKSNASGIKKPREIAFRKTLHERIDQPSEKCRNATAQRDGLKLDIDSTVFFLKSPVTVKAPEKAAIFSDGLFPFIQSIRVFHFRDPLGIGSAVRAVLVHAKISHIKFRVEYGSDNRFLVEPKIDVEMRSV